MPILLKPGASKALFWHSNFLWPLSRDRNEIHFEIRSLKSFPALLNLPSGRMMDVVVFCEECVQRKAPAYMSRFLQFSRTFHTFGMSGDSRIYMGANLGGVYV
jgi:hypothetical protein